MASVLSTCFNLSNYLINSEMSNNSVMQIMHNLGVMSVVVLLTALWTTVAHPSGQFLKHVNGCILGVKLFYKHSFGKKLFFF